MLKDILETEVEEKYYLKDEVVQKLLEHKQRHKEAGHGFGAVFHDTAGKMGAVKVGGKGFDDLVKIEANSHLLKNITDTDSKANAFLATSHKGAWANGMTLVEKGYRIRRITPTEAARLQTVPEYYHWTCSETQQYRLLGNGWTVEVIKHIFSFMRLEDTV